MCQSVSAFLQMVRGGPPKLPKPYALYKEEKRQSQSNSSSPSLPRHEDGGPDAQQVEKLISFTPPSPRGSLGDSGPELVNAAHGLDSSDTTSITSSSSSTSQEGDHDLSRATDRQVPAQQAIPPIPPPRPHRKKAPAQPLDISSSQVISNQMAANEKSLILNSRPRPPRHQQSLDFSSSVALALVDIDPLAADCLQNRSARYSSMQAALDLAELPTPLEPTRSGTPSSGSGRSSTDMSTSTSKQSVSEADWVSLQQERKRSNAMQTVYRATAPQEGGGGASGSKGKDPFAELLLQANSQWPQKGSVGQEDPFA